IILPRDRISGCSHLESVRPDRATRTNRVEIADRSLVIARKNRVLTQGIEISPASRRIVIFVGGVANQVGTKQVPTETNQIPAHERQYSTNRILISGLKSTDEEVSR